MNGLSLKQLQYFSALARRSHFAQAARDCAISQPALSHQIRELEQRLGLTLIDRSRRKMSLTAAGHEIAKRADDILARVEALATHANALKGNVPIRLGMLPTVAPYLLPALLKIVATDFPGMTILPQELRTETIMARLGDGQLDAAIMALPAPMVGLQEIGLGRDEFLLVRSAKRKGQPLPNLAELSMAPLLLLEEGHCLRDQALDYCAAAQNDAERRIEGNSLTTLVQMVAGGLGMTLIPRISVGVESRTPGIEILTLPEPAPHRTLGLVWAETSPFSDKLAPLAEALRHLLAKNDSKDEKGIEL